LNAGGGQQGILQGNAPATQQSVNLSGLTTRYVISGAGAIASASNASNWTLTLVSNGGLAPLSTTLTITAYWQASGTTCTAPVAGRIFARLSGYALTGLPDRQGYSVVLAPVAGTVMRTFDSDDRLCLQIQNTGQNR